VAVIEPENLTFFFTRVMRLTQPSKILLKESLRNFFQASLCTFDGDVFRITNRKNSAKTYFPSNAWDIMSTKYENSPGKISGIFSL
jgi:hypothetical protein